MNRPRQYDRNEVLEKSTHLFWEKGFEATSMNEVAARTGINKFSIYNEFGDKEKLFITCIDHYVHNFGGFVKDTLEREPLGLSNIEAFFEHKVSHAFLHENKKGCLVFNSTIENESLSKEANQRVNLFISRVITLFSACLNAAQKRKEISANKNCKDLAEYLGCFYFGLVNVGMKSSTEEELRRIAKIALLSIKN